MTLAKDGTNLPMDFSRFNTALSLVVAKYSGPTLRSKSIHEHSSATPSASDPLTPLAAPEAASPQVADEVASQEPQLEDAPVPRAEAAPLLAEAEPATQAGPVIEAFEPPLPHTDAPPMRPRRRKKLGMHTLERLIITALTRAEIDNHAAGGGDGGDRAKLSMHALFSGKVLSGLQRMHTLSEVRDSSIADRQCSRAVYRCRARPYLRRLRPSVVCPAHV